MRTWSHNGVCHQVAGVFGRREGEEGITSTGGVGHCQGVALQPATGFPTTSSSAADVESQDPDSTNLLESEAPRDYFLKCK